MNFKHNILYICTENALLCVTLLVLLPIQLEHHDFYLL
jgi:hypothetical protein